MRRRGARGSRSKGEPIDDSTLVFPGSIRVPEDTEGLSVEISWSGGEIVMRTDEAELGRWTSTDVIIRPIDSTSFEFIAEADRLVFTPGDPTVFGASPLIAVEVVESGRRKRRKATKKSVAAESMPTRSSDSTQEKRRRHRKATSQEPSVVEPPKLSRKERKEQKAAARTEAKAALGEAEATTPAASSESTMHDPSVESPEASPTDEEGDAHHVIADIESATPPAEPGGVREKPSKKPPARRWIWMLDSARRHDLFGLDRVPIDESLRGEEHEHTWDHRVATRDGLASHVCTICGKIKL